jgi:hypothetical protein
MNNVVETRCTASLLFTILALITLFCSGFAQSPNVISVALEKKITEWVTVPCEEMGFCVVAEKKSKEFKQLIINHFDISMQPVFDTIITLPVDYKNLQAFYENGTLVVLYRIYQQRRYTDVGVLMFYHPDTKTLESREISGLPTESSTGRWHHYAGNMLFSDISKRGDQVWFLPAGATQPTPFGFTRENPGKVLCTAVDTAQGKAVICFATGGRIAYFETDFTGKSSFANILNEPATHAQWVGINRNHSLLMLYYEDDETFYMHPVNILNHKVTPSETVYCADFQTPKTLPASVKTKQTIIISPYSFISFLPTYIHFEDNRISCITELYSPEYYNYFNGWYVEPRFNGYRYERADVHFFDTNGVFQTNVTFPYGNEGILHSTISYNLNIKSLESQDWLLYYRIGHELTTMLLDSALQVKDPIRVSDLPLPKIPLQKQKIVVDLFTPWYGNKFLLTDFRINAVSMKKNGFDATRLEYR